MILRNALAVAMVFAGLGQAQATPVMYGDRASWEAAVGGSFAFESFESAFVAAPSIGFPSGVTVSVSAANVAANVSLFGVNPTDGVQAIQNSAGSANLTFTFAFASPINAFAIDILDFGDIQVPGELLAATNTGSLLDYLIASAPQANGNVIFFGFVDTLATFSSVRIRNTEGGGALGFDSLAFANVPTSPNVPEPSTLALLGLGLAGLGVCRRKREGIVCIRNRQHTPLRRVFVAACSVAPVLPRRH